MRTVTRTDECGCEITHMYNSGGDLVETFVNPCERHEYYADADETSGAFNTDGEEYGDDFGDDALDD